MGPLEVLSEAVIDILKGFSIGKRPLTSATLQEAFSARDDVLSLLCPVPDVPTNGAEQGPSASGKEPAHVPAADQKLRRNQTLNPLRNFGTRF